VGKREMEENLKTEWDETMQKRGQRDRDGRGGEGIDLSVKSNGKLYPATN
jgi:hypothetical protein